MTARIDLDALAKLAELARMRQGTDDVWFLPATLRNRHTEDEASFIAAADPATVAALVRVVRACDAVVEAYGRYWAKDSIYYAAEDALAPFRDSETGE